MSTATDAHHPHSRWETLVKVAMLGLDRAKLPPEQSAAPWRWNHIAHENASEPLMEYLRELSALAIYDLAGSAAIRGDVHAASETSLPIERWCLRAAGRHLDEILYGGRLELLAEWTAAARAADWIAPPELLPALLERAILAKDEVLRRDIVHVAGERGAWLAAQHAEWRVLYETAQADDTSNTWETGTLAERLAHLRATRATDQSLARELVSSVWDQESAGDRASMVEQFAIGLSSDDESWLEERLDDRSKQVRGIAARLLSMLPATSLSRRMADRVRQHVRYVAGSGIIFKKRASLEITLPEELDETMKRDGLEAKALRGMGPKAVLLSQIVSRAPLDIWLAEQNDPATWIEAALNSEWSRPLVEGWTTAAVAQKHPTWSLAILTNVFLNEQELGDKVDSNWRRETIAPLVQSLPPAAVQPLAAPAVAAHKRGAPTQLLDALLLACNFPWNTELSEAVVDLLHVRFTALNAVYDYALRQLMTEVAAVRLSPAVADRLAERVATHPEHWSANFASSVDALVDTLRFRRDMLVALAPSTTL